MSLHRLPLPLPLPRLAPLAFAAALASALPACASSDGAGSLDAASAAMVADSQEIDDFDDTADLAIEEPLSGAAEGAEVTVTLDAAGAAEASKTNAGTFFKPAGCLVTTVAGNVVTRVFSDCTGPYGYVHLTGTITSTWSKITDGVSVKHEAKEFLVNGAVIDHVVTVAYTRAGGVYQKTRHASSNGITARGHAITHAADFVTKYDAITKCLARDGAGQTTIAGRALSRTVTGYQRCGIGSGGCPKGGQIVLKRDARTVEIDFPGGAFMDVKIDGGAAIRRPLLCRELA
jgi:hypothetical protein